MTDASGGALQMTNNDHKQPFRTNVTITHTTFADNHADNNVGNDIHIWRDQQYGVNAGAVPCLAPGKACDAYSGTTRCCFDGDHDSLTVTLPSN
eukprot:COSAG04_NODE_50_length_31170_cov_2.965080_12_plen_94_part_00